MTTCILCGEPADGTRRVAFWQEEEKGRLSAKSAAVCEKDHALFLEGRRTRVEVARRDQETRGYRSAEWIDRIDRDALLDISCLSCGILLPIDGAPPERFTCPRCQAVNHFADRHSLAGATRVTSRLESAPR
jgi:hypothetical protein